jgi:hypothetical protein
MKRMPVLTPHIPLALPPFVALALLGSPTWGTLDYHASLALAPVVGLCAMILALQDRPLLRRLLLLVTLPLLVLLLGGLFVPNCNRLYGLGFYALGPVCAAFVGVGWARLGQLLLPRHASKIAWAGALLSALPPLWHFLTSPQVFAYHGLIGYVAGALYEDAVRIQTPYLTWRLFDLLLWLPIIAVPRQRWTRGLLLAQTALLLTLLASANTLQWRIDGPGDELPAKIDAPGQFHIHLPRTLTVAQNLDLWHNDVAFRYHEMALAFGTQPHEQIELFFYASAGQKQRLMGANRVDMAKPWLHQVHMVLPDIGSTTLTHELAHVFAAEWAQSPLGIPLRYGVVPDAVAVEGLAVAMEWPVRANLDPHQWTRAMRQAKLAPKISQLWSLTGFLGQQSDRAYTVAGSFLRWLSETRGWPTVRRVYAGEPLETVTGVALADLESQWGQFVDDAALHPLTDVDLARARLRFARPGLFEKPCALETGRACQQADRLAALNKPKRAVAVRRKLLAAIDAWVAADMDDPELHLELADDLAQAGQLQDALAELALLSARTGAQRLHPLLQAAIDSAHGDLRWRLGQIAEAEALWRHVARQPVSEPMLRTLEVKLHFSRLPAASEAMASLWLIGSHPVAGGADAVVERLFDALPQDPVVRSLWARRLLVMEPARGLHMLNEALPQLLGDAPYTASETARQVMWRHAVQTDGPEVPLLTRLVAELAVPPSLVAEWRRREAFAEKSTGVAAAKSASVRYYLLGRGPGHRGLKICMRARRLRVKLSITDRDTAAEIRVHDQANPPSEPPDISIKSADISVKIRQVTEQRRQRPPQLAAQIRRRHREKHRQNRHSVRLAALGLPRIQRVVVLQEHASSHRLHRGLPGLPRRQEQRHAVRFARVHPGRVDQQRQAHVRNLRAVAAHFTAVLERYRCRESREGSKQVDRVLLIQRQRQAGLARREQATHGQNAVIGNFEEPRFDQPRQLGTQILRWDVQGVRGSLDERVEGHQPAAAEEARCGDAEQAARGR